MIVRRGNAPHQRIDYGPTPVEGWLKRGVSGALVVGQRGARIDDPAKVAERNARRATTRAGRAA